MIRDLEAFNPREPGERLPDCRLMGWSPLRKIAPKRERDYVASRITNILWLIGFSLSLACIRLPVRIPIG
jgi:hypothetical protein